MGEDILKALVWLGFFAAVFLGWYFYLKARNKERMALIESGKDVSEIYAKQEIKFRFPWLKLGIILTGGAFGFLISFLTMQAVYDSLFSSSYIDEGPYVFGVTLLFTAISIIVAYFIDKPKTS